MSCVMLPLITPNRNVFGFSKYLDYWQPVQSLMHFYTEAYITESFYDTKKHICTMGSIDYNYQNSFRFSFVMLKFESTVGLKNSCSDLIRMIIRILVVVVR